MRLKMPAMLGNGAVLAKCWRCFEPLCVAAVLASCAGSDEARGRLATQGFPVQVGLVLLRGPPSPLPLRCHAR